MATSDADPTDESLILSTVQSLLSAVPTNSLPTLLAPTIPEGGAQTLRDGVLSTQSISSLCSKILLIPGDKAETFHDIEVKIDPTRQLAMVWAASKVWMGGELVIEGTNALTLHKVEAEWKVSSISDVSAAVEGRVGEVKTIYGGGER